VRPLKRPRNSGNANAKLLGYLLLSRTINQGIYCLPLLRGRAFDKSVMQVIDRVGNRIELRDTRFKAAQDAELGEFFLRRSTANLALSNACPPANLFIGVLRASLTKPTPTAIHK
jgi:hypothetical protein